jgi:hypothetical protein
MGLVYVENIGDVCVGAILNSDRQRFCCKLIGLCVLKGRKTKLKLESNTLYIQHTQAGQGRLEPSLPIALIPDDITVSKLVAKEHSLKVWTAYFDDVEAERATSLLASPASTDSVWLALGRKFQAWTA